MNSEDDLREQIGRAQVAFRQQNEQIQASADKLAMLGPIPFICECPDTNCMEVVDLSFDQYDALRVHPQRFFNVSGHEQESVDAGAERVLLVAGELTVVEKIGIAGLVAGDDYRG